MGDNYQYNNDGTAFTCYGNKNNPALVLIHGLGLTSMMWQSSKLSVALSDRYYVISYDLYWHGTTSTPLQSPSLYVFAEQLDSLLRQCNLQKNALVGFSLGGMIARYYAQTRREMVTGLAILNSPHRRTLQAQKAIMHRVKLAEKYAYTPLIDAALNRWFTDEFKIANPQLMLEITAMLQDNYSDIYASVYRVLAEEVEKIIAPNPPIVCPTLVVSADEDHGNNPAMAQAIAADIVGAKTLILPGLRHMALFEQPKRVARALLTFFDAVLINKNDSK